MDIGDRPKAIGHLSFYTKIGREILGDLFFRWGFSRVKLLLIIRHLQLSFRQLDTSKVLIHKVLQNCIPQWHAVTGHRVDTLGKNLGMLTRWEIARACRACLNMLITLEILWPRYYMNTQPQDQHIIFYFRSSQHNITTIILINMISFKLKFKIQRVIEGGSFKSSKTTIIYWKVQE